MGRRHQTARDGVGGFRAAVLAQQVQTAVDTGRGACRSQDFPVIDVEDVGIHLHVRVTPGKILRIGPVRGGLASVEQARLGQHVGAEAQADDTGASSMGGNQGIEQGLWRPLVGGRASLAR